MTFFGLLLLLALVTQVVSREIVGVFTDLLSLDFQDAGYGYRAPSNPIWYAKLSWNLDGAIHNPGDTFSLNLPGVFKFLTGQSQFAISAGGVSYATCTFQAGEQFMTFSVINCVVSDSLTANIQAYGTVAFPFSFNAGGSALEVDLVSANQFKVGTNTITFRHGNKDLSVEADFQSDPFPKAELISSGKIIPSLRKICHLLVCAECTDGYESGVLGLTTNDPAVTIDCDSVHIGATNELNPWLYPMNSESLDYTKECDAGKLLVTFKNVPAGYRPFVDTLFDSTSNAAVTLKYTNTFTCMNGEHYDKSAYKTWAPYKNGLPDSDGAVIVVTTRTDTYSTTAVTTLPFDPEKDTTKTIEVIVPIPTTTTTTSYVGIETHYSTITATIGGTATVIVHEPVHTTTTVTTCWLGDGTTTFTDIPLYDSIATVVIQTEHTNPTVTTRGYDNIMEATSYTAFNPCGGTDTVFIAYPSNGFTTRTTFSPVEELTTYTETDTHGGTDTVVVVYPHNAVTTTTTIEGVEELTTYTRTDTHGGTDTVVVVYPPNSFTTRTTFSPVEELTTYTETDTHGGTDTVVVVYPHNAVTTTTTIDDVEELTTYTQTDTHGGTDTVVVVYPPNSFTTRTTFSPVEELTTYTETDTHGGTDTVVVVYPHNAVTTTTTIEGVEELTTYTQTDTHGGTDTVVVVYPPNSFTTRTTFSPVEELTTYTETDTHGGTDTVVVVYPHNAVTTTTTIEGVEELTTYTQTDTHGGTDTVVVVYPPNPTVTTTDFDSVSELTSYTQTESHGGTDTIVIIHPFTSSDVIDMRESTTSLTLYPEYTDSAEVSDSTGAVSYPTTLLPGFVSADDEIPIPSDSSDTDGDYETATSHPGDDISTTDSNEGVTITISSADYEVPTDSDYEVPTDSDDDATVTSSGGNSDIALSDDNSTASVTSEVDETTFSNASDDAIASDSDVAQAVSILEDEMPTDSYDGDDVSTNADGDVSMTYESSATYGSITTSTDTIDVTIDDSKTADDLVSHSNDDIPSASDPAAPIPDTTSLPEGDPGFTSDTTDVSIVVVSTDSSHDYVSASTIDDDGNVSNDSKSSTSRHPTSIAAAPPVYTTDESIASSNDGQVTSTTLTDVGDDSSSISETDGFTTTDIAVTSETDESGNSDDYYITSLSLDVILSRSIGGGRPKYENISYGRSLAAPGPVYSSGTFVTTSTVGEGGNDAATTEGHDSSSQGATSPAITIPTSEIVTVTECTSDCTSSPSGGQQGTSNDTSGECSTGCHSGDGKVIETEGAACSTSCTAGSQKATATDADQSSTSCTLAVCGKKHGKGSNRENGDGEGNEGDDGNEGGESAVSGEGKGHHQVNEDEGSGSGASSTGDDSTGDGSAPELDNDAGQEGDEPTVTFPISESTLSTAVIDHEHGNSLAANSVGGSTFTFDAASISNYEGSATLARASTWLVCLISVLNILI
ncbi:Agglutinin-like protein 3 [Candida viswanathii]|uniref:Agglutinin-like protein 3 n=1 Tax=Candida viswanathii TaxID=5486 RepID=A0A367YAJ3_9ASCO|nr:Agglutinin-like protein 3 [Candida viswanathii]